MQREYRLNVASRHDRSAASDQFDVAPDRIEHSAMAADGPGAASAWCRAAMADFKSGRVVWDDESDLPIPDFDDRPMLSVSGRARGLIEAIEPAVHHFLPVVYCDGEGQVIERRYFLIVGRNPDVHRLGKTHLWHDGVADQGPRLSPTLAEAIRAAGMTGLDWGDGVSEAAYRAGLLSGRNR